MKGAGLLGAVALLIAALARCGSGVPEAGPSPCADVPIAQLTTCE